MPSTDTVVELSLPRNYVGQILDGLEVLIEQWEATAAYHRSGEIADSVFRECSDAEEAEWIAEFYASIVLEIRGQMEEANPTTGLA